MYYIILALFECTAGDTSEQTCQSSVKRVD